MPAILSMALIMLSPLFFVRPQDKKLDETDVLVLPGWLSYGAERCVRIDPALAKL
jgi:hypothetical protein